MFELGTFFSGIVADLFENDLQNAKGNFERFKTKYVEVSKMVPEWVKEYPKDANSYISLALAYSRLGQKELGVTMGQKAMKLNPNEHIGYAQLFSVQGRIKEAIDQLELLFEKGYRNYIWIKIHPDFHPLYEEPRFRDLINKGLKKSDKQ